MGRVVPPEVRRRGRDLVRSASAAGDAAGVFAVASRKLNRLVANDASAWLAADPVTGLPVAPSLVQGITVTAEGCSQYWEHEFVDPDVNLFRDLGRAPVPASALRSSVADPRHSARFRRFLRPHEFSDELRAVLRVRDAPWATVTLWRRDGSPPFSAAETALVADLAPSLGEVLRGQARATWPGPENAPDERPGLLIFTHAGKLVSANEAAQAWLEELPPEDRLTSGLGLRIPVWLLFVAIRARQDLEAGGNGTARCRVRSARGQWLVCHASTTRTGDGSAAETAVMIEPAAPTLLAPIVVAAYGLTEREAQITRLIARGAGTGEIAGALFLSPYTVKDHVKAVLRKFGASSRGELVAMLYADHYEPVHLAHPTNGRNRARRTVETDTSVRAARSGHAADRSEPVVRPQRPGSG
jgi:DNA-binding CsgD family transcriptional regulator